MKGFLQLILGLATVIPLTDATLDKPSGMVSLIMPEGILLPYQNENLVTSKMPGSQASSTFYMILSFFLSTGGNCGQSAHFTVVNMAVFVS